jgi:N-methylhydantoinase A
LPNAETEILTWSLSLSAETPDLAPVVEEVEWSVAIPIGTRPVFSVKVDAMREVAMYRRTDLALGAGFDGPGIVVEDQTSTFVPQGFYAQIAANGYIVIKRNRESE